MPILYVYTVCLHGMSTLQALARTRHEGRQTGVVC